MMTWGEIEGTPFLLDASDKPVKPVTPGPVFKVPSFHESQRHVCVHCPAFLLGAMCCINCILADTNRLP